MRVHAWCISDIDPTQCWICAYDLDYNVQEQPDSISQNQTRPNGGGKSGKWGQHGRVPTREVAATINVMNSAVQPPKGSNKAVLHDPGSVLQMQHSMSKHRQPQANALTSEEFSNRGVLHDPGSRLQMQNDMSEYRQPSIFASTAAGRGACPIVAISTSGSIVSGCFFVNEN